MRMFGRRMDMCILINIEIIIMHMTFSELYLLELLLLLLLIIINITLNQRVPRKKIHSFRNLWLDLLQ